MFIFQFLLKIKIIISNTISFIIMDIIQYINELYNRTSWDDMIKLIELLT